MSAFPKRCRRCDREYEREAFDALAPAAGGETHADYVGLRFKQCAQCNNTIVVDTTVENVEMTDG